MTPADIIYQRRCRVIERAAIVGVSQACQEAGVSRTSYYRWCGRASRYGLSALVPKGRRRPAMPNGIPAHEEEVILAEALARPTLGARRLLEHLQERKITRSASGVHKVLRRHNLGTRRLRVAALAALTAADTGLVAPRALGPYGFCLYASQPGELVGLDCFYVGKLKGIGPVWQLTAVDTATRWAFCSLTVGHVDAATAAAFVHHLATETWEVGMVLRGVLTDNGPEFIGRDFTRATEELGSPTIGPRPAPRTTTPWWSGSTRRSCRSATARRFTAAGSTAWRTWRPSWETSSTGTTPGGATTATTCGAGPRCRSSRE